MKDRIKKIRAETGLSMEKFGERIGITRSSVCKLESGENSPSEQTIRLICKEFGVNKNWFLENKGDPYNEPEDEVAGIVSELLLEDNPFYDLIINIMQVYKRLDDNSQKALKNLSQELLDKTKKRD